MDLATFVLMALFNVQVIHPFFTGLPRDVIVNNLHFIGDDSQTPEDMALLIRDSIVAWINGIYSVTGSTKAAYIDWPQSTMKVFKLSDPPPRVPAILPIATVAGTGASTIPTEVACVATFQARPESGVRYQRLYNRVYLGGLMPAMVSPAAADQFPRFTPTFCTSVANAMDGLATANPWGSPSAQWVQVSNAGGITAAREIIGGWVDNGPDTQRRRSVLATLRTTWNV